MFVYLGDMNAPVTSSMDPDAQPLLGVGLYTVTEAARLLAANPATVRRWMMGYGRESSYRPGIWAPEIKLDDGERFLSFRDLIELRIALKFGRLGVHLRTLRKCHQRAIEELGTPYPFSTARFATDGKAIFLDTEDVQHDEGLLDLRDGQWTIRKVVADSFKDIDRDERDAPRLWWALDRRRTIVIDPARSFGQPIAAGSGVPSATLAMAAESYGSEKAAAVAFEVQEREVRDAVAFEGRLAA